MNIVVPKYMRELRSFIGVTRGIILEGNVHDEFPIFDFCEAQPEVIGVNALGGMIESLSDENRTDTIFFDPIDGFYCNAGGAEEQESLLLPLFEGYTTDKHLINHGNTVCFRVTGKKEKRSDSDSALVWVSEIVRRRMTEVREGGNVKNTVFVLNFASRLDACNESPANANTMFLNFMQATTAAQTMDGLSDTVIMVVDKFNDIPAWLYLKNPNIRTVSICVPDRITRRIYLNSLLGTLRKYKCLGDENNEAGKTFVSETEGMQLQQIKQILRMAFCMGLAPEDVGIAFRIHKYGVTDNPWENLDADIVERTERILRDRVKGQDEAIEKIMTVVARAVKGMSGLQHSGSGHKPKGTLFFAGPTGVGKTEAAKALAEAIFGDEQAFIRFDMSEYREAHSDQKLFGAPPGYVGYDAGGQLTNAIKEKPFSIILFDEIEKASPTILDKFLQILEDGRMTDNQGNTVYFGETIIIFTSNIGLTKEVRDKDFAYTGRTHREPTVTIPDVYEEDSAEFRKSVSDMLTNGVKTYFTDIGRPELLNRLGENNIVVFNFINLHDAEAICDSKMKKVCRAIESEKGIRVDVSGITELLHREAVAARANGGRGVGNMIETVFINPFAQYVCSLKTNPARVVCSETDDKVCFGEE